MIRMLICSTLFRGTRATRLHTATIATSQSRDGRFGRCPCFGSLHRAALPPRGCSPSCRAFCDTPQLLQAALCIAWQLAQNLWPTCRRLVRPATATNRAPQRRPCHILLLVFALHGCYKPAVVTSFYSLLIRAFS